MRKHYLLAAGILAVALYLTYLVSFQDDGQTLSFCLLLGLALGFVLQRSRFCFLCHSRDWMQHGDARGLLAIVLAIAVGSIIYPIILGSWLPVPERLPPDMHIGPVSWALLLAGLAFGTGMVISGSCISAHLYRLSEGSAASPFALIGTVIGFWLGFQSWNTLYSATIASAPVIWLPQHLGYAGALALQLFLLGLIAYALWRKPLLSTSEQKTSPESFSRAIARSFEGRWPYWTGGIAVGIIAAVIIIRTRPLGVTSALGSTTRQLAEHAGIMPLRLDGLDSLGGCATIIRDTLLTPNAILVMALVAGAFIAALPGGHFKFRMPTWKEAVKGLSGGVFLGWGSMIGLGCTVGNLLSGIMAGAVSGWVFGIGIFVALWFGFKVEARLTRKRS
jgi:uncharacterized membrane protein YedE/YeeE